MCAIITSFDCWGEKKLPTDFIKIEFVGSEKLVPNDEYECKDEALFE